MVTESSPLEFTIILIQSRGMLSLSRDIKNYILTNFDLNIPSKLFFGQDSEGINIILLVSDLRYYTKAISDAASDRVGNSDG
jgi:hypothetical protein